MTLSMWTQTGPKLAKVHLRSGRPRKQDMSSRRHCGVAYQSSQEASDFFFADPNGYADPFGFSFFTFLLG